MRASIDEDEIGVVLARLVLYATKDGKDAIEVLEKTVGCLYCMGAEPRPFIKHHGSAALNCIVKAIVAGLGEEVASISELKCDDDGFRSWRRVLRHAQRVVRQRMSDR